MNLYEILCYKFPNANFNSDIMLADEGNGIFIQKWNLEDLIPTEEDLGRWEHEADLWYRQKCAVECRIYPPINDQLDMMYHDKLNGTNSWADSIQAIKNAHPKPTE